MFPGGATNFTTTLCLRTYTALSDKRMKEGGEKCLQLNESMYGSTVSSCADIYVQCSVFMDEYTLLPALC